MKASSKKRKIIDIFLIILFFGLFAIPLAALCWHQPKISLLQPKDSILLSLKRFYP
jgi:hypothetical protein